MTSTGVSAKPQCHRKVRVDSTESFDVHTYACTCTFRYTTIAVQCHVLHNASSIPRETVALEVLLRIPKANPHCVAG